jgi:hypothetical protein
MFIVSAVRDWSVGDSLIDTSGSIDMSQTDGAKQTVVSEREMKESLKNKRPTVLEHPSRQLTLSEVEL